MQQQAPTSWMPGPDPASRPAPTTFDEASMERSKSFVKALQVRRRRGSGRSRLHLSLLSSRAACREIRVLRGAVTNLLLLACASLVQVDGK